ncbi:MAG: calcium-binding protein [Actinomycetota bacterium]|nr:calcium-binding protein [Actinomycetota bacterium]
MAVVLALGVLLFTPTEATAATGTTTRVSVASDGSPANAESHGGDLSGNGRYVTFYTRASNLVPGDTNGAYDIFVHDRHTAATSRVSVHSDGTQANGDSERPSLSGDGRYVVFESSASNLVADDTNGEEDVFVHDRFTGATTRVSVASGGVQGTGNSYDSSISANGQYVAFSTVAANLMTNVFHLQLDPNRVTGRGIVVHDRKTGLTTAVGAGHGPSISADGLFVAFHAGPEELYFGPDTYSPERTEVFVHDRTTATTTWVSKSSSGAAGDESSSYATISGDGRFVAFTSYATNLVAGDTNGTADVFVHDRRMGTTTRVSVSGDGTQGDGGSSGPSISADGRYLAFSSTATNLVAGDTSPYVNAFVHDRHLGATTQVGVASDGTEGDSWTYANDVSDDGNHVSFDSWASNLVPGDTPYTPDVFVHSAGADPVVSVGDVSVHEGDAGTAAATFTVSLSAPSPVTVTVSYTTAAGTAGAGDFTARAGAVTFAAGATSATVKVPVGGDTADEANEAFVLMLSSPAGAVIGDGTGAGTILDDDPPAVSGRRVAIGDVAVHEGDAGSRSAMFTVSLSKASTSTVSVSFATAKGTATGGDFTASSGKLSFAAGTTSLTVEVRVTPDTTAESDESFSVKLSNASGATIADATGTGTVVDDD